jgi:hypothetical protein
VPRGFRSAALHASSDHTAEAPFLAVDEAFGRFVAPNKEGLVITVLIVVLVLMMLGSLPTWPHSSGWSYYPSGGLGLILLILIVLALSGRL